MGFDPLPTYLPPKESRQSKPELATKYPLQLLSPPRPQFLNSSFVNIPALRSPGEVPVLLISAVDAESRSLKDGDGVRIFNDRGAFEAIVVVSDTVHEGLVVAEGIWWHKLTGGKGNANLTTSTALTDLGGGATFFDNLVEVAKV
jgi:anaerobic selenocysteine-containing dehydrogenase